jgi:hypothetical protein
LDLRTARGARCEEDAEDDSSANPYGERDKERVVSPSKQGPSQSGLVVSEMPKTNETMKLAAPTTSAATPTHTC